MDIMKLEKALTSFITGEISVSDLARILSCFSHRARVDYRELKSATHGSVDDALLALWEWKLVIPVRSSRCSEWDSRIFLTAPEEIFEMPNISRTLVEKGMETGRWDSTSGITDLFQRMGEPEWEKMPHLIHSIRNHTVHNTINGAGIGALCTQNGLNHKTGAMIAVLKGAGIISPKLAAIGPVAKSRSPLYEFNPSVYAEPAPEL